MESSPDFFEIAAQTAEIVEGLRHDELAEGAVRFDFEFRLGDTRIPANLTLPTHFPAKLPKIELVHPDEFATLPHVNSGGEICYREPEGLSVALWDPTGVIIQALHETHRVLTDGLTGTNRGDVVAEISAYWAMHVKREPIHVALRPGDQVKALTVWTNAADGVVLISDTEQGRARLGQHAENVESKRRGLYLPVPGYAFDRPFLDGVACGEIPLKALTHRLGDENRRILASHLKRRRDRPFLVLGVGTSNHDRGLLGLEVPCTSDRHPLEYSATSSKIAPTPFLPTRVDRHALLPRAGASGAMAGRHVIVVGCGSLGGHVAMAVAHMGVRRLTLVDDDDLAVENVYRHVLGFSEVGHPKATALARRLAVDLPHLDAHAIVRRVEDLADRVLDGADLVIGTIGNATVHRLLNRRLVARRRRAVFGWLEPLGLGGHALLLGSTRGCLECLFVNSNGSERLTAWSDFADPGQEFARRYAGCGGAFTPFADLDARRTADLVAELAAHALANLDGPGQLRSWQGATEQFTAAGFRLSAYSSLPPDQLARVTERFARTRCPVCAT